MVLEDYGWDSWFDDQYKSLNLNLVAGRVTGSAENFSVVYSEGTVNAGVSERLFYAASSDSEFPVTGDWVLLIPDGSGSGFSIYDVLPRKSYITYTMDDGDDDIAAANVDFAIVILPSSLSSVQTVNQAGELFRDTGIEPLFIFTGEGERVSDDEILSGFRTFYAPDGKTAGKITELLTSGKSYLFAGVNKAEVLSLVREVSSADFQSCVNALKFHDSGAILYLSPLLMDAGEFSGRGRDEHDGFEDILEVASQCRFSDCRHQNEPGCAVLEAVENGDFEYRYYREFLKALKKGVGRMESAD